MRNQKAFLATIAAVGLAAFLHRESQVGLGMAVDDGLFGGTAFARAAESAPFVPLPEPTEVRPQNPTDGPQVEKGSPSTPGRPPGDAAGRLQAGSPGDRPAPKSPAPEPKRQGSSRFGLWQILKAGGTVGFVIIVLSLVAGALAVEQLLTLRRPVLIPPEVVEKVTQHLKSRDLKGLWDTCTTNPCVLTAVLKAGISEWENGWHEMEKALEDAVTEQTARLLRRVEYLSVIGNLAPMLGLLGTVVGMILAFRTVAETQGAARAADLAEAIYLALVTTVEGLLVAIPALGAYAFFRNRVDELMAEVAVTVQQVLAPLRRRRAAARPPVSPSASSQSEASH